MSGENLQKAEYKHTPLGWIPNDWKLKELQAIALIVFSNVDKHLYDEERQVLLCNYKDVYYNNYIFSKLNFSIGTVKESEYEKFKIKKGDVIITKDSEDKRDIAISTFVIENIPDLVCGYHLALIRPTKGLLDGLFLSFALGSYNVNHYFQKRANGITRFGLDTNTVKSSLIPLPDLMEQRKIATILSTWDDAISQIQQLIFLVRQRNKGLSQTLLTGKMIKQDLDEQWREVFLGDVFNERSETNFPTLPLLSIGASYGVTYQSDGNKKDTSNEDKSKYRRICPGDIGYNTMRMWQGRSALSDKEGIVSPAYTIVIPHTDQCAEFYIYLFKLPSVINKFFRKSQGLVEDTLNCKYKDFAKVRIRIPEYDEQKSIATILTTALSEVKFLENKLALLQRQKKGLVQKLLTGEIRVKLS